MSDLYENSAYTNTINLSTPQRLLYNEYFRTDVRIDDVKFADFAQRRFIGFRHEIEFDVKFMLVGSKSGFEVLSYRKDKVDLRSICYYELSNQKEEIVHVSFVDQEKPMFVVMITAVLQQNNETSQLRLRLLALR